MISLFFQQMRAQCKQNTETVTDVLGNHVIDIEAFAGTQYLCLSIPQIPYCNLTGSLMMISNCRF